MSLLSFLENSKNVGDGPVPTPGGASSGAVGVIIGIQLSLFSFSILFLTYILKKLKQNSKSKTNQEPLLSDQNTNVKEKLDENEKTPNESNNEGGVQNNIEIHEKKWYDFEFTELEYTQILIIFWFSNSVILTIGGKIVLLISFTSYAIMHIIYMIFEYKEIYPQCRMYMKLVNCFLLVIVTLAAIIEAFIGLKNV